MTPTTNEHFNKPRNHGKLSGEDGAGRAGDPGCGAVISLFIRFDGRDIGQAGFIASGSSAVIAAGSLLTCKIMGKSWQHAAAISSSSLAGELLNTGSPDQFAGPSQKNGLREDRIRQAAAFAIDALHAAIEDSIRRGSFPRSGQVRDDRVIVAMSGGVDSSVACLLEKERGLDVIGVTMRLWCEEGQDCDTEPVSCCSPLAIREAREVCHQLRLPHITVDFTEKFENIVVKYFIDEYITGRTPNPCTRCNGVFRFPALIELADAIGAAYIATGHYAGIMRDRGNQCITTSSDREKDQSYMLWSINRKLLDRITFPLAKLEKSETRRIAKAAGLITHARPESQEVCFIPDDDYRRFLSDHAGDLPGEGEIVSSSGKRLGTHSGYINYTCGQRRGLGISHPSPLYVLHTSPERNEVVVGERDELAVSVIIIDSINRFQPLDTDEKCFLLRVRYNSSPVAARIELETADEWRLRMDEPVYGVAPGQSAVIYSGDSLIAGGIIRETG